MHVFLPSYVKFLGNFCYFIVLVPDKFLLLCYQIGQLGSLHIESLQCHL